MELVEKWRMKMYQINEHRTEGGDFVAIYSVWDSFDEEYHEERVDFLSATRQDAEVQARSNSVDGMVWRLIRVVSQ